MQPAAIATTPMTVDVFREWTEQPQNANRWFELVRGEVIELPAPTKTHGVVCMNVAAPLWAFARTVGKGYVAINDSGVILQRSPDTIRGPDVAFYEDAASFADLHPKYGEAPPRLAVEVLSSSDRFSRVTEKLIDYLDNGVAMVWLIEPELRTVTVCRPGQLPRVFKDRDTLTGEDVLPGFSLRVADLFLIPGEGGRPDPPGNPTTSSSQTPS